jgi:hypothetical protein
MPFVKGDPRINRKGRPKSFDKLRALAVGIAGEQAVDQKGNPILWNGKPVTNAELMLRMWLTDKKYQKDFAEVAFGKVPQAIQISDAEGGPLKIELFNYDNSASRIAPRPTDDNPASGQNQGSEHGPALGQDVHSGDAGD